MAAACGGSESGGGEKSDSKGKETVSEEAQPGADEDAAEAPEAVVLTAKELEGLVLAAGDLDGHTSEKLTEEDAASADEVSVDTAGCEPLAYALQNAPLGEPVGVAQRRVVEKPAGPDADGEIDFDFTMTMTSLYSYEGAGAAEALAELRAAAADCSGGFTLTGPLESQKILSVSDDSLSVGEEAAAWTVVVDSDGLESSFKVAAVRQGTTLAVFGAFNFGAALEGRDMELPTAVIEVQAARLS